MTDSTLPHASIADHNTGLPSHGRGDSWFQREVSRRPDQASHQDPGATGESALPLHPSASEWKKLEADLRRAEQRYRSIFENAVEGIFQTSPTGQYLCVNPALARIYGYDSPEELRTAVTDIANQLYIDPVRRAEFSRLMAAQDVVEGFESQIRRKDGAVVWIIENARAVYEDGKLCYYEGFVQDITESKQARAQLMHDAYHDRLTGLANRFLFMKKLESAVAADRSQNLFAVLFMDLDRFKLVNDTLGHATGDELLVAVSRRISGCLRPGDTLARLGGDEFAVLLECLGDRRDAVVVVERIQRRLKMPFLLNGLEVQSGASIGIAYRSDSLATGTLVLSEADAAMYRAKRRRRRSGDQPAARAAERYAPPASTPADCASRGERARH